VESTLAFAVLRSEQWKPSLMATGCCGVLFAVVPSAESVA
jgi:hypothetical protein